jgi:hypothetical protein
MENYAKLISSIARLVGALAWPTVVLVIIYIFRKEIGQALVRIGALLEKVKKASVAGLVLELERVANAEVERGPDQGGRVTPSQIAAAARIEIQSREVNTDTLLSELDKLSLQYDFLRRTLPSGPERTRAMTRVVVQMRALAPSVIDFLEVYKGSASAGSRLAAITMMQMVPQTTDLDWLGDRFKTEHPFLFYHAALALQNIADRSSNWEDRKRIREVALDAIATIKNFSGPPDRGSLEVLETLASSLPKQ